MQSKQAFTLIELAIILIITGLLIGGVLVGKDLIRAAMVRAQVSQIETLDAAMSAFRNKYACIPGDCAIAVRLGVGTTGGDGDNGNGNGKIETTTTSPTDGTEVRNVWIHLSRASLLSWVGSAGVTPGVNSPPLAMPGQAVLYTAGVNENAKGGMWLGEVSDRYVVSPQISVMNAWLLTASRTPFHGIYLPADAYALDSKIDDGLPSNGRVMTNGLQATWCSAPGFCNTGITVSAYDAGLGDICVNDMAEPNVYDFTSNKPSAQSLCQLTVLWGH